MAIPVLQLPEVKLMLRDLRLGPASALEIARLTRRTMRSVHRYLRACRDAGLIHITTWERCHGSRPIYGLGGGADAPRIPRLTIAEKGRRSRARKATNQRENRV